MKFFKIQITREKKKALVKSDTYQDSLNILGREQFRSLLEKGLQVPIALL